MHNMYIYNDYQKYELCTGACLGQVQCQWCQSRVASKTPPHTIRSPCHTLLPDGHELHQVILYMHTIMMQPLNI
jgi:hypothetical protein